MVPVKTYISHHSTSPLKVTFRFPPPYTLYTPHPELLSFSHSLTYSLAPSIFPTLLDQGTYRALLQHIVRLVAPADGPRRLTWSLMS